MITHRRLGRVADLPDQRDKIFKIDRAVVVLPSWYRVPNYGIEKFAIRPTAEAYTGALAHRTIQYQWVDNTNWDAVRAAVFQNGNLIIGVTVYESFMSNIVARNGKIPLPKMNERVFGGHAMRVIGYTAFNLIVANSWGRGWGDFGLCYIPKEYITNPKLASDFWTLVKI